MDTHPILMIIAGAAVSVASAAWWVWAFRRSAAVLDRWAATNGYRIVARQWRVWLRGPYFFRSGEAQWVFRLTVADAADRRRDGYARVGGFFLGLHSDAVDVTWDADR